MSFWQGLIDWWLGRQSEISRLREQLGKEFDVALERVEELETKIAELEKSSPPLPAVVRAEISYGDLAELFNNKFPDIPYFISDSTKYLCDIEDIQAFLEQDATNRLTYVTERFDCDDFTYRLMGQFSIPGWSEIAKGIIWTDKHALLGCVDANRDFWYIEPQSDSIQSKLESWQGSILKVIMM